MKLLHLKIENYRIHKELEASLNDNLILIRGVNESGKSTIAEAIHRVLFLKHSGNTELHKSMQSRHGGNPSVELCFEAHSQKWTIKKIFSGQNGSATLSAENGHSYHKEQAEEKLAQLLGYDSVISGGGAKKQMDNRWAHLWVWQGTGVTSPVETAEPEKQKLYHQLQSLSGTEVIVSKTDNLLIENLNKELTENLNQNGSPKVNSKLGKALTDKENAENIYREKKFKKEEFHQASINYRNATEELKTLETALNETALAVQENNKSIAKLNDLNNKLNEKKKEADPLEVKRESLLESDRIIKKDQEQLKILTQDLNPLEKEVKDLENAMNSSRKEYEIARSDVEEKATTEQRLLQNQNALETHARTLQIKGELTELQKQLEKSQSLENMLKESIHNMERLSKFTPSKIKSLQKMHQAIELAQSKLDSYAMRLKVTTSDENIYLNDKKVSSNDWVKLTETTELRIGENTHISLQPGGSSNLDSALKDLNKAKKSFWDALQELSSPSLESAQEKLELSEAEKLKNAQLKEQYKALTPKEAIAEKIEQLEKELANAKENAGQFTFDSEERPLSLETANELLKKAKQQYESSRSDLKNAQTREKEFRKKYEEAQKCHENIKSDFLKNSQKSSALKTSIKTREEIHGNEQIRKEQLNQLNQQLTALKNENDNLIADIQSLNPENLEITREMLENKTHLNQKKFESEREKQTIAKAHLQTTGSMDLENDLKVAEAQLRLAEAKVSNEQNHINIIKALHERCRELRKERSKSIAKPLEEKTASYLQDIYGPDAKTHFIWNEDNTDIKGFNIVRNQQNQSFTFDELSHGTREQASLALRLAMAEVLAKDYDSTLPIVLDDAFTHSDRQRIQSIHKALFRATQNGLQLLVLTCHPENYTGLTSSEIQLNKSA